MSNRKKIASIAFTGAAAATATMMGAAPAMGAPMRAASIVPYRGVIKGHLKAGTTTVLVDTTKNTTLTCKKAFLSGSISKSNVPLPAKGGFIKKATTTWSSCTGPFGLTFKAHLTTSPNLYVKQAGSPPGGSGKLSGNKISLRISGTGLGAACHATLSGTSIPWKYVNATHSFIFNSGHLVTLHVKSQANCLGAINTSDAAYFAGTYHISTPMSLIFYSGSKF